MNFEIHEAHSRPGLFYGYEEPMFVGVCPPHDDAGPWSEPAPYRPPTEAEAREQRAAIEAQERRLEADPAMLSFGNWATDARSELAVQSLRRLQPRIHNLRFDVELWADAERRQPVLPEYHRAGELWFAVDDDQRAVVGPAISKMSDF